MSMNAQQLITVFPNPVTGILNIRNSNPKTEYQNTRIIDSAGEVVHTERMSGLNHVQLDASSFPNGLYLIELTDNYGHQIIKKFIK